MLSIQVTVNIYLIVNTFYKLGRVEAKMLSIQVTVPNKVHFLYTGESGGKNVLNAGHGNHLLIVYTSYKLERVDTKIRAGRSLFCFRFAHRSPLSFFLLLVIAIAQTLIFRISWLPHLSIAPNKIVVRSC